MGIIADSLRTAIAQPKPVLPDDGSVIDEFGRGLNSGLTGIGAGLRAMTGTGAEVLGADQFAQGMYRSARDAQAQAQLEAPSVSSYKQVLENPSLRSGLRYTAGLLGGSTPSIAAGVGAAALTGGAALPAMAAATAAQVPIEAGDVALKQLNDTEAMQMSAGERLARQIGGGAGSAALQGIVPGIVGGKLVGQGAKAAVGQSSKTIIGRNLIGGTLAEAGLEGASDALKQTASNDARPLDWDSITENVVGGGVAGGAMGSIGAAADLAYSGPLKAVKTGQDALTATGQALSPAWDRLKAGAASLKDAMPEGVTDAMNASGKTIKDQIAAARAKAEELMAAEDVPAEIKAKLADAGKTMLNSGNRAYVWAADLARGKARVNPKDDETDLMGTLDGLSAPKDDSADRIMKGQPLGDLKEFAGATQERASEMLGKSTAWVKAKAEELYQKADLSDERRAQLSEAMQNLGDRANQVKVATIAKATEASDVISKRIAALSKGVKDQLGGDTTDPSVKKSEDYSGMDAALLQKVAPVAIRALAEKHGLDAADLPADKINGLAPILRQVGTKFARGDSFDVALVRLQMADLLGSDGATKVMQAIAPLVTGNNREAAANYFRNLATFDQEGKSSKGVSELLNKYGKDYTGDKETLASELVKWASGHYDNAKATPEERSYNDAQVRTFLEKNFGANAKNILSALDRSYGERRGQTIAESVDADGEPLAEVKESKQHIGGGKAKRTLVKAPGAYRVEFGNESVAERIMKEHTGKSVKFVSVSEDPTLLDKIPAHKKFKTDTKKKIDAQYTTYLDQAGGDEQAARQAMSAEVQRQIDERVKFHQKEGHGLVEVQDIETNDSFTNDEVSAMRLDTDAHSESPSRIQVADDLIVDAVRLTRAAGKKMAQSDFADQSPLHRMAQAYMSGLAQLMMDYGKFPVSGKTVIGRLQGKDVTAADAIKAYKTSDTVTSGYGLNDPKETSLSELKNQGRELRAQLKELQAEDPEAEGVAEAIDTVAGKLAKTVEMYERMANAEHFAREKDASGKMEVGKDENIHMAAAELEGRGDMQHRVNMDGTTVNHYGSNQATRNFVAEASAKRKNAILAEERAKRTAKKPPPDAEGHPDPKPVAAKKAAFLERAASGDEALIKELRTSSDAKGLQRAMDALLDAGATEGSVKAMDAILARMTELVRGSEDVAYGLQTKKYSLESGTEASDGQAKLITRLADARRSEFADANEAEVFVRSEGTVSFGPVRGGTKFFFSDGRSTHAYIVAPQHVATVKYNLSVKPLERHADVLSYFAVQHAFLDRANGEFQSFAAPPSSPTGKWLDSIGAVEPTGEFFGDGTTPINRVVGVSSRQTADFLADALAYTKKIEGTDKVFVDWTRITGAKKGKRGSGWFNAETATNPNPLTAKGRKQVLVAIHNMLGNSVQVEFAPIMHSGEFFSKMGTDIIRVSVTALNPTGTAYHEALHAFFKQMRTHGSEDVNAVLTKLANTPHVMKQLRELLKHSPEALNQLSDPEERAAYLFQFHSMGHDFKLADAPKTLFTKLKEKFLSLMGVWTNDERALHVMEYFSSGEYAQNMNSHTAVRAALMESGRNKMWASFTEMTKPFMDLAESVVGAGSANLRDSGIPSLAQLADHIKKRGVDDGKDAGYLPAARLKRTEYLNQYARAIEGLDKAQVHDLTEAMQNGTQASTPEARIAQRQVRKLLDDVFDYLHRSGVNVGDLGYGKDYFPRRWDAHYLSKHRDAFMLMARKYPQWHDAHETYNKLIANDGSELQVVTERPGMSSNMKRVLSFIDEKDAAPFMSKDIHMIVNSYLTQATRRAEWANRFGDDNNVLESLYKQAAKEGATPKQVEQAKHFVQGVIGTLGDDLNPTARRLMGDMVVYQNVRLLPLAVFSMAIDPMGIVVNGGGVRQAWDTFVRGIKEIPKGWRNDTSMDEQTKFAQDMGTIDNAMLQHAIGSMYTQGVTGDFARKVNDTFFRLNLVEQMNTSMRVGATQAAKLFLVKHADSARADKHSTRRLQELGLTATDVKLDANGELVITPKIKAAINQWVDGAILRPDAADKPVWMNDPHYLLFAHLKQFVYAFQHTTLARVVHEAKNGNYTPAMALSSYVPIMMASDAVKGLIQGGGDVPEWKKNWTAGDYLGNAVQRAGLLGVGQFGVDAAEGQIGTLTGPSVEQLVDLAATLGGRESFRSFALHSLPANQLFAGLAKAEKEDPVFSD